ncbi:unnamed protein product [Paramecium octaurelia]|uniref:Uncharacterized protein n=1 Tax=Paramecium octaurelia TaxID=43137 RepID=A0A8S1S2U9_PAROT|nr:unnamed protein product [Paramecium octaurelia]
MNRFEESFKFYYVALQFKTHDQDYQEINQLASALQRRNRVEQAQKYEDLASQYKDIFKSFCYHSVN